MPGVLVFRPADANEVLEAWRVIMPLRHEPAVLVFSRQTLPTLDPHPLRACLRPLVDHWHVRRRELILCGITED